jgi:hypothetical protein
MRHEQVVMDINFVVRLILYPIFYIRVGIYRKGKSHFKKYTQKSAKTHM